MRGGRSLRAVVAAALVVAATTLGAGVAPAAAPTPLAGQVTFVPPGGGRQQTVALATFAGREDVRARRYAVRDGGGGVATVIVTGISLGALLDTTGIDPYSFTWVEVARPSGGSVLLTREQLLSADAFPDGPPVVYADGGGLHFLRPSGGKGDANAGDGFLVASGTLTVTLHTGQLLGVQASASPARVKPGAPVRFTAALARSGAGDRLGWSWIFGDGTPALRDGGTSVVHRYAAAGTYRALVTVTTPDDPGGASAVVDVVVGDGKGAAARRPPAGAGGATSKPAATPAPAPAPAAPVPTAGATGRAGATAPGRTAPATRAARSPRLSRARARARSRAAAHPRPKRAAAAAPRGRLVEGELVDLSGAGAAPATAATATASPASTVPQSRKAHARFHLPPLVWQLGLLALLLLGGWALEGRHPLPTSLRTK